MKIKYLGPGKSVNVGGFGAHRKGQVKEYPDEVGQELLATAKKQRFKAVTAPAKTKPNGGAKE